VEKNLLQDQVKFLIYRFVTVDSAINKDV